MFTRRARAPAGHRIDPVIKDGRSRQDLVDDIAMHVREPIVAASVAVYQACVIKPHQMQDGGVKIMHVHRFFDRPYAVLVSCAVHAPRANAGSSQP
jgi:hypothetical protein